MHASPFGRYRYRGGSMGRSRGGVASQHVEASEGGTKHRIEEREKSLDRPESEVVYVVPARQAHHVDVQLCAPDSAIVWVRAHGIAYTVTRRLQSRRPFDTKARIEPQELKELDCDINRFDVVSDKLQVNTEKGLPHVSMRGMVRIV
eukprot:3943948-Prymnesium_polylepis.1